MSNFSIIIPTCNADKLKASVSSIISNTNLSNGEIIIVANGIPKNDKYNLWFSDKIGFAKAVNEGIKIAKGEHIVLLHDDTMILRKDWLPILLKPFENPKVGIVGIAPHVVLDRKFVSFVCCVIKKTIFNQIGLLEETFSDYCDADLCFRAEDAGWLVNTCTIPNKNLKMRGFPLWHANGEPQMNRNIQAIKDKHNKVILINWHNIWQKKTEINALQRYLLGNKIEKVLEIGIGYGGTAVLWAKMVEQYNGKVFCADLTFKRDIPKSYENIPQQKFIAELQGDSHNLEFKKKVHEEVGMVDLLLIDGDHSYAGTRDDFYSYRDLVKPGGFIVFHDIVESEHHRFYGVNVAQFWKEIKHQYEHREFIDTEEYEWAVGQSMGIGVLVNTPRQVESSKPEQDVSIVIPTCTFELLQKSISSIVSNTDLSKVEVIIVANGASSETKDFVNNLGSSFKLVWFDEKIGATKALNEGIKVARGKHIILLNDDVVVQEQPKHQWIEILLKPFQEKNVGITGPTLGRVKIWEKNNHTILDRQFMSFFCVAIKQKVIESIGLLDEIFNPGCGEDVDFCIKAENKGYKMRQTTHLPVKHLGTFKSLQDISKSWWRIIKDRYAISKGTDSGWAGGLVDEKEINHNYNPISA